MKGLRFLVLSCSVVAASAVVAQQSQAVEERPQEAPAFKVFTNAGSGNRVAKFDSDGTTLINSAIHESGGWIGVNTTTPSRIFTVELGAWPPDSGYRIVRSQNTNAYVDFLLVTSPAAPYAYIQVGDSITWRALALQPHGGVVGIGTATPNSGYALDVYAKQWGNAVRAVDEAAMGTGSGAGVVYAVKYTTAGDLADVAVVRGQKLNGTSGDRAGKMVLQVIDAAGNWSNAAEFRPGSMTFTGDAHFTGAVTGASIAATYQDVAEWVPSRTDLPAGTVVVLDAELGNGVRACSRAYDTTVAGVISDEPGIILGVAGAQKERVATTGRVLVNVDASGGPIAVGDLLVTSNRAGYAMKSVAIDVGGIEMHRPGTIVGKALQALPSGEGQILVLLSLQ